MKPILLLLMAIGTMGAFAQSGETPAFCWTDKSCKLTLAPAPSPPVATWSHAVKDGVYTATFTDPQNHWRCFVTGTVVDHPGGFDASTTAFTVTCVDTTKTDIEAPTK